MYLRGFCDPMTRDDPTASLRCGGFRHAVLCESDFPADPVGPGSTDTGVFGPRPSARPGATGMNVGTVLLAAGQSVRFGAEDMLLAPLDRPDIA